MLEWWPTPRTFRNHRGNLGSKTEVLVRSSQGHYIYGNVNVNENTHANVNENEKKDEDKGRIERRLQWASKSKYQEEEQALVGDKIENGAPGAYQTHLLTGTPGAE